MSVHLEEVWKRLRRQSSAVTIPAGWTMPRTARPTRSTHIPSASWERPRRRLAWHSFCSYLCARCEETPTHDDGHPRVQRTASRPCAPAVSGSAWAASTFHFTVQNEKIPHHNSALPNHHLSCAAKAVTGPRSLRRTEMPPQVRRMPAAAKVKGDGQRITGEEPPLPAPSPAVSPRVPRADLNASLLLPG